MAAVEGLLDGAVDGHGAVVGVVGPPGIGKSRLVREVSCDGRGRGVEVFTTFCESHTSEIPFHAVTRLLRTATESTVLTGRRPDRVRDRFPMRTPRTCCCSMTCWASRIPMLPLPDIEPDARRRRLTALRRMPLPWLGNPGGLCRRGRTLDRWGQRIDARRLFRCIPQTPSLVLITYRPEYGAR